MNLGRCFASPTRTRREVDSSLVSTYRGRPETWRGGPERMRDFETSPGNHARMVQSEPPEINAPDGRERSDRKLSVSMLGSSLSSFASSSSSSLLNSSSLK